MRYSLEVLGACDLTAEDGVRVESVLQQPRRLALLVYMALVSRTGPVQRDAVLAIFWPESDTSAGRNSLSQALHYLRRSIGDAVLSPTQTELQLDRELVQCDAVLFLDAVDEGDWSTAANLYSGELLPGFSLLRSPHSLEAWIEEQRDHLKRSAATAAWHMSERSSESGDSAQAAVWARRAVKWSGNEELRVRQLMALLDDLNDRAGVLAAYQELERSLSLLDCTPAEETKALLERFRREWEGVDADSEGGKPATSPDSGHSYGGIRFQKRKRSKPLWIAAAMVVAFMATLLWAAEYPSSNASSVADVPLVFDSLTGDRPASLDVREIEWEVVNRLSSVSGIRVVTGRESSEATPAAGFYIAARLSAQEDSVWVHLRLVVPQTGAVAYSRRIPVGNLSDLNSDRVAWELSQALRIAVGRLEPIDHRLMAAQPTTAEQFLALSSSTRHHGDSLAAAGLVEAASAAYVNGDSLAARAAAHATTAPQASVERSRLAHSQAWLAFQNRDLTTAVKHGRRGLEFTKEALTWEKGHREALEVRAEIAHWLWALGKHAPPPDHADLLNIADEAVTALTELDPTYANGWNLLGALAWSRGDFPRSYWALRHAVEQDRYLREQVEITARLFHTAWEVGDTTAAEGWCAKLDRLEPNGFLLRQCTLMLEAIAPQPDTALISRVLDAAPLPARFDWQWRRLPLVAAVALAKAGDGHRARALIAEVSLDGSDRDLLADAAWARLALGEHELAHQLLGEATSGFAKAWLSTLRSRKFQDLERSKGDYSSY